MPGDDIVVHRWVGASYHGLGRFPGRHDLPSMRTEREKMLAGEAYQPMDPELVAAERRKVESGKPVEIGEDVWVGGGAIILPGVRMGTAP